MGGGLRVSDDQAQLKLVLDLFSTVPKKLQRTWVMGQRQPRCLINSAMVI